MKIDRQIADLGGEAALPRKNGELVFQAPWQGRAFGLAVVLNEKGAYLWDEFRAGLVDRIAKGEPEYYESWLNALESLLLARGVVTHDEVAQRAAEYQALQRDPVF
jgi:nitrile hydratase accessory protein